MDERGLAVGAEHDDAVGRLRRREAEALVAGAELLGAEAVGEGPPGAPEEAQRGAVAAELAGHLLDDLVEMRVGVDDHDAAVAARHGGDELGGAAEADEGLVGVDDGDAVAAAVGELLEVVGHHALPHVGVGAQQLLDR